MNCAVSQSIILSWVRDEIGFRSETKSDFVLRGNLIWLSDEIMAPRRNPKDEIGFGSDMKSETKSELGDRRNAIWVRDQIRFGSETKSDLGPRLNWIWVRDQIGFGYPR